MRKITKVKYLNMRQHAEDLDINFRGAIKFSYDDGCSLIRSCRASKCDILSRELINRCLDSDLDIEDELCSVLSAYNDEIVRDLT